jgi:hypothetical protein
MPRFQFEISEEQRLRVNKVFTEYGQMRSVMGRILDEIMDMVEEHGYLVFGIIMDKDTNIRKIVPSLNKADKIATGGKDGNDRRS